MESTLKSEEPVFETVRHIADLLFPEKIRWQDIKPHALGYKKEKAVEQIVKAAKEDPIMTKIRLFTIYTRLRDLANNGGLL